MSRLQRDPRWNSGPCQPSDRRRPLVRGSGPSAARATLRSWTGKVGILGEFESREVPAGGAGGAWWNRAPLSAAVRAHPTGVAAAALVVLAVLSAALRTTLAREVHGPF